MTARPGKILCVGLNYADHAAEANLDLPTEPLCFAKWPTTLIGDGDAIRLPSLSTEVDYEAELAVIIGTDALNVAAEDALDYVAGYACFNDVSARDIQMGDGQWTRGKSFDTFGPLGRVTPASEVADPQSLRIRCLVNDTVVQDSTTANMVHPVAELIAYFSRDCLLEAGDIIATGTPAGVGVAKSPPLYLTAGDVVTVEIDGLATLSNPIVA